MLVTKATTTPDPTLPLYLPTSPIHPISTMCRYA